METLVEHHENELGILSHAHARGLRRDLFRMVGDRTNAPLALFRKRCELLDMPYRSARERNAVFARARQSLQRIVHGFHAEPDHCSGLVVFPAERLHGDGHVEPLLELQQASIDRRNGCMFGEMRPIGSLSHHAVERIFQRLPTTSIGDVMHNITGLSVWFRLFQIVSIASVASDHIEQLPLPSPHGVFLCVRETEDWRQVHMRTWIRHGASPRYDASVASIVDWCRRPGDSVEAILCSFEAMASRPENHWWRTPHQRE